MRFCDVSEVPEKSVFTRLFCVFASAMLANFQDRLVMTASITLRNDDATECIIVTEPEKKWLDKLSLSNPLRIPHPKFDKLACQTQGAGIFAAGEITIHDADCTYLI